MPYIDGFLIILGTNTCKAINVVSPLAMQKVCQFGAWEVGLVFVCLGGLFIFRYLFPKSKKSKEE